MKWSIRSVPFLYTADERRLNSELEKARQQHVDSMLPRWLRYLAVSASLWAVTILSACFAPLSAMTSILMLVSIVLATVMLGGLMALFRFARTVVIAVGVLVAWLVFMPASSATMLSNIGLPLSWLDSVYSVTEGGKMKVVFLIWAIPQAVFTFLWSSAVVYRSNYM